MFFFFFSSRRRHTRSDRDWSSDVCSSDLIDLDHAGSAARGVGGGRAWLLEREEQHGGNHWFGSVNFPPVPLGRIAVTTLKSGSDVNPSPSTWRFGSSNTNGLSELTSFLAWK